MRIAIVAGEASGDQLAAGLVAKLKQKYPNAIIEGIAGEQMQEAGAKSLYPLESLSVMGFVEVIKHLPEILKIRFGILKYFKKNRPDIYIGVDAPDFNLPIEKKLHKRGIKTVHYVSPSVWAWREGRMKTIKKSTDVVLAILPFEEKFYKKHNHKAVFVGHPLANKISMQPNIGTARNKLRLNNDKVIIAILPGSRAQEVERLLKPFLQAASILQRHYNHKFKFVIPVAKKSLLKIIAIYQDEIDELGVKIINGKAHEVLEACDYVMLASGTAALEAMLYKKPMVMAYKLSAISYQLAKLLVKTRTFSLPNILASDDIIPELIQNDANGENIAKELMRLMEDKHLRDKIIAKFYELHNILKCDSDTKAAQVVEGLLNKTKL